MRFAMLCALGLVVLATGCSSTAPPPSPGLSRLYAEPPARRWESYAPYVKVVAIDGKETGRVDYLDMEPGYHELTVTAHRDAAANGMSWGLGIVGSMVGSAIDQANSAGHLTHLPIETQAGQTYLARLHDDGLRYSFWVETYPQGRVVSGSKPSGTSRARNPR